MPETAAADPGVQLWGECEQQGEDLFDEAARLHLGMSGEDFLSRWDAGFFDDDSRPEVLRVVMLLPFVR